MSRRYFWLRLLCLAVAGLLCEGVPARAQTQDIGGGVSSKLLPGKPLSIREIRKRLDRLIETKDLRQLTSLGEGLQFLEHKLSDGGKVNLEIVLREHLFKKENPDSPDIAETKIKFPPFPKRMSAATALRILLSKVPTNNATYRLRAGQIQVTTIDDAATVQLNEPVGGSYRDRPLAEVLDKLAAQSGVTIILDRRVSKQGQVPVRAYLGAFVSLQTALRLLTDMADLRYVIIGNAVYVTSPANADKAAAEVRRRSQLPLLSLQHGLEEGGPLGWSAYDHSVEDQSINRPLAAALEGMTKELGASLIIDWRVREKMKVSVRARLLNGVSLLTILPMLTDMADLSYVEVDGVIYITSPANALKLEKKLLEEMRKKKPPRPDKNEPVQK
jgi:hypothetical protein